jgi:hypothetical protein
VGARVLLVSHNRRLAALVVTAGRKRLVLPLVNARPVPRRGISTKSISACSTVTRVLSLPTSACATWKPHSGSN